MKKYPLRIIFWETTVACNLGCIHCRRQKGGSEASADELSTEEAKAWIGDVADWCSPVIILSGGEPLKRTDIVELASYISGKGLRVALATNGTLVTERIADELLHAGVGRVSVSLDGARPETHDDLRRVPGAFGAALRGMRILKNAGLSTQINMAVCRDSLEEVGQLFELAKREGVDAVHLFIFVPVGCGLEHKKEQSLSPREVEDLMEWFYRYKEGGRIEARLTCAPQYQRLLAERGEGAGRRPRGCLAGRSVCFVSHSGDVFPCGYLPVSAGNVRDRSLRDIWEGSEVFIALRDVAALAAPCGRCVYRRACGGCRARAYAETGDYLAGDRICLYPHGRRFS